MKTALVLTGHMRDWKTAFPSIKSKLIDRYQSDVFISSWKDFGYWVSPDRDPKNHGYNTDSPRLTENDIAEIYSAYHPISFLHPQYAYFTSVFMSRGKKYLPYCQEIRPQNVLSQFFQIHSGILSLESYVAETGTKYDMVIRTRPDLVLQSDLPEIPLDSLKDTIYTNFHRNHTGQGTGDMLQVASFDSIIKFKNIVYNFDELTNHLNRFCPHMFVESYVKDFLNLNLVELNLSKTLAHTPNGQYINYEGEK